MSAGLELRGKYYDGQVARAHDVIISCQSDGLHIRSVSGDLQIYWPLDEVQVAERPNPPMPAKLARATEPESRIFLSLDTDFQALQDYLPPQAFRGVHLSASWPSIALYSLMALAFIAVIFISAPRAMEYGAYMIPPAWETKIGDYTMRHVISARVCTGEEGRRALDKLAGELHQAALKTGKGRDISYQIHVVHDDGTLNALAAPGGHIALFSGAVKAAESGDEIAGVLAHEMAHIELHHPMRGIMRDIGLSAALQLMTGSENLGASALQIAGMLHQMRYSREKESEADRAGYQILRQAGLDPKSLALFLQRLPDLELESEAAQYLDYLSTHPRSSSRIAAIAQETAEAGNFKPAFTRSEWRAIKNMCGKTANFE